MKKKILILASAVLIGGASFVNFGNVKSAEAIWPPPQGGHITKFYKDAENGKWVTSNSGAVKSLQCPSSGSIACTYLVKVVIETY